MGYLHVHRRQRWKSRRVDAADQINRPSGLRRTFSDTQLQTRFGRHGKNGNPGHLLLLGKRKIRVRSRLLCQRSDHRPPDFAAEELASHYYAARETSSAPLRVASPSGDQRERFLFYRGVSNIALPVSAKLAADNTIDLQNRTDHEIPNAILFERRGDKVGYRILGSLPEQSSRESAFPLPELSASLDSMLNDLEGVLISQGLFPDEAHAMVQTWKDSWFEEGARLFYILPRQSVDTILPLSIQPTPTTTVRVFVGRLELVTPATERDVEFAFASNDRATLAKYGRFVEPILRTMLQKSSDPARTKRLATYLNSVYNDLLLQAQNSTQ
jgi:hypothetical protein